MFPQALLFGARLVSVPARGTVLCASAGLPFRLSDGCPVKPNDYYAAVSEQVGKTAIPDTMAPLPGAELLVLGAVPRPERPSRVRFRCGQIVARLRLHPDPDAAPGADFAGGPEDAVWHGRDNPWGRGGEDDSRAPLIEREDRPQEPVWLGATPFEHPARSRLAGAAETLDASRWPTDADPAVLYEAHPAFRTRSLHAGDPLEIEGLAEEALSATLPPYRAVMATSRLPEGTWHSETARIHSVVVIPRADIAAVFWRAALELGDDILAEKVIAIVAALEDVDGPRKDEVDLGVIAADRWEDPVQAMDDRPLLPRAMAAAAAPFAAPDSAAFDERQAAAEDWARKEFGAEAVNPFAEPDAVAEVVEVLDDAEEGRPPDLDRLDEVARGALTSGQRRHEAEGFAPPEPEEQRPPVERGDALAAEAAERLAAPYRAPRELAIVEAVKDAPPEAGVDVEDTLARLASGRLIAPEPVLSWPAFEPAEAERFGEDVLQGLSAADPARHVDVSGAIVGARPGAGAAGDGVAGQRVISGRRFEGLLAEETVWRNLTFEECVFRDTTFAKGRFENCEFRSCELERVNLSYAQLTDVTFVDCTLRELSAQGCSGISLRCEDCALEALTLVDFAIRDSVFAGGSWTNLEFSDALFVRVALLRMEMNEVTFSLCHCPECRFEDVRMFKVWVVGMGFAGSVFDRVEAKTCTFMADAHLQQTRFERTRFELTGFGNARFHQAEFGADCAFVRCDLTGAEFLEARMPGIRFLDCALPMTVWHKADASGGCFMGCVLRGVDFSDAQLMNAVFAGADIEGAVFNDRLVLGADFRGTVRSE